MTQQIDQVESGGWEQAVWDIAAFHPAVTDPRELSLFLDGAARDLERVSRATGMELLAGYCTALREVVGVLAVEDVLREVSAPAEAQSRARLTETAALRCQQALAGLQRALADAAPNLLRQATGVEAAFLRDLVRRAEHLPPAAATPWAALARRAGLERPRELHAGQLKALLTAELRIGSERVELRPSNVRALLASSNRELRRAVWSFQRGVASDALPVLEMVKSIRADFRREEARLLGYADLLEAACADFRISQGAYRVISLQRSTICEFADGFYRWKQKRLGLERLEELDLTAQPLVPESGWLELRHVTALLEGYVGRLHSGFPGVLHELWAKRALLTDSRATFSSAWFTLPHYGGGTPLVHLPYHGGVDEFCAAAHELGHACHTAVVSRQLGALAAADECLCYSEVFGLVFEIAAVNQALEHAHSASEREFWRGVVLEQAVHFLRTLPIRSRFDELTYLEHVAPGEAWARAHAELSPHWLPVPSPGDAGWALSTSSEDAPFQGHAYALAFFVAYLAYLEPERGITQQLLSDAPWQPFEDACRSALRIDLRDHTSFGPVWEHLNGVLKHV